MLMEAFEFCCGHAMAGGAVNGLTAKIFDMAYILANQAET
jgi:hypothetical protein